MSRTQTAELDAQGKADRKAIATQIAADLRAGRNLDKWIGSGTMPAEDEIDAYARWAAAHL